jgi:cation diffusion facilitator family transporter
MKNPKSLSIISSLVNLIMAVVKIAVGFFSQSFVLMAEGLHSIVDFASSLITFLGIKAAEKPADKEHPYGHERYESLAGLAVVALLFVSACWILFEVAKNILSGETIAQFTILGIILMACSAIINEIMARLKFSVGNKFSSLALVADAEHSRADVYSSLAVLTGLVLVKFYPMADSILAVLVAFYIFYEVYRLSKEIVDSLVDTANPELEEKIKKILEKNFQKFSEIKTRKIGPSNFAEISLIFDPREKMDEVTFSTKKIEEKLLNEISELKQVSLSAKSHDFSQKIVRPRFGGYFRFRGKFKNFERNKSGIFEQKINVKKRIAIPLENNEISSRFGALEYLIIDIDKDNKKNQRKVKNQFYKNDNQRHGVRFVKTISADKVVAKHISENARENLKSQNIEIEIVEPTKKLEDLI